VQTLVDRAQRLRSGGVDPRTDNMLKITGDGRKAALDMRLVQGLSDPHGDTKLNRAVERIYATWDQTRDTRSTQLVFCDLSTPNPDASMSMMKSAPSSSSAASLSARLPLSTTPTPTARRAVLFDSVNAGRVRILLGSTEKMGAGTNVQKRLKALHHLDAPWRPRDIEQREGRILRQGNGNAAGRYLPLCHRGQL
jgi:hypothetical protein